MKGVEKVKYMHGDEERMNTRNQEHLVTHTHTHTFKLVINHSKIKQQVMAFLLPRLPHGDYFPITACPHMSVSFLLYSLVFI